MLHLTSLIEDLGSRIEDIGSRIEDLGSRIEDYKTTIFDQVRNPNQHAHMYKNKHCSGTPS